MRRYITILMMILLSTVVAQGQIMIGGNVYGGGNEGNVDGSTKVTVRSGDLKNVFGGARMANVGGNSYVNIDGAHASGYMVINYVFGGNDISGTIGTAAAVGETLPTELNNVIPEPTEAQLTTYGTREAYRAWYKENNPYKDDVDNTWNSYVHISSKMDTSNPAKVATDNRKVYIGQLFAGGNGAYTYDPVTTGTGSEPVTKQTYDVKENGQTIATITTEVDKYLPEVEKAYLDVQGGSIVYAYGGGNNATVKEKTVIHVDNPSKVVNHILVDANTGEEADEDTYEGAFGVNGTNEVPTGYKELLSTTRFKDDMGINIFSSHPESGEYQIGRFFGGNNIAEMSIQPTWNLQGGLIRNLYSGGNQGAMTCITGLLLEINPEANHATPLVIDNVYGGCRMADVRPLISGTTKDNPKDAYTSNIHLDGYNFPDGLPARVLVRGGDIHNVYGGNDVTGKVWGGNAIGIYASISGDVYGGGNGSYPYTDNEENQNDPLFGDFYYGNSFADNAASVAALNAYRPNAEQVSIRVLGTDAAHPTIIGGSIYCGGNSATLINTVTDNPMVHVKIGSHVIADKVFLGNNGKRMTEENILKYYADHDHFSSLDLTNANVFKSYMEGAAMSLIPDVVTDDVTEYVPYTTKIGSLYLGGNVGSMTYPGVNTMDFDVPFIIYNKVVGGCNDAFVDEQFTDEGVKLNARYMGGILGSASETDYTEDGQVKNRLILNFGTEEGSIKLEPRRWVDETDKTDYRTLVWNTVSHNLNNNNQVINIAPTESAPNVFKPVDSANGTGAIAEYNRRLYGGNVYGGCYNSGTVNGNVVININKDLVVRGEVFASPKLDSSGEPVTDDNDFQQIDYNKPLNSGVLLFEQGDDVLGAALNVFGSGYGLNSEVRGNTTINMNGGYTFQLFGGGELGTVQKYANVAESGNATVNLNGGEVEYLYGGGFEGKVFGHTLVNLGNGTCYDALGGACNADIGEYAEVYVGRNGDGSLGFPNVRDYVFGGNDFGGHIIGTKTHSLERNRTVFDALHQDEQDRLDLLTSNTYVEYIQGKAEGIFGGNFGYYTYADEHYKKYTYSESDDSHQAGDPRTGFSKPFITNSFVYFNPVKNSDNYVGSLYGGSQGNPNELTNNNSMQEKSYVLVDDNSGTEKFKTMDVFGAGAYGGLGTVAYNGVGRSVIDLFQGHVHNVYGASNSEGLVGYTRINVPGESTIRVNALYGGGKGYEDERINDDSDTDAKASRFCDTYVSCIDYQGENAYVEDAIYGGNQNCRITFDTYVNIGVPVKRDDTGELARVYGAGYGSKTVCGRTNVCLNDGAKVNEVYGGGRDGNTFNFASLKLWLAKQFIVDGASTATAEANVKLFGRYLRGFNEYVREGHPIILPKPLDYNDNIWKTRNNDLVDTEEYYNTNVHILEGALVKTNTVRDDEGNNGGYAYGGGHGKDAVVGGRTYIELKGGTVDKDIYGAGWGGPVYDEYKLATDNDPSNDFIAGTNVYIEGGTCRNVYGGGYEGTVGYHEGDITASYDGDNPDILGETHVVIGRPEEEIRADSLSYLAESVTKHGFYYGRPAVQRNAYGGGEGGAVYGTANITVNNGYIGFVFNAEGTDLSATTALDERYEENIVDYTWKDDNGNFLPNQNLYDSGCVFGGGYVDNSSVDFTYVTIYDGHVRNSLFGGGEIAAIGRGTIHASGEKNSIRELSGLYKAGKTHVEMYGGHVHRDVFGGGRGYNNLGLQGELYSDGFVFGQTEVHVHGGEVGTTKGLSKMYGNVFGGGDIGYVYSAYEYVEYDEDDIPTKKLGRGIKKGERYDDGQEGYYYRHKPNAVTQKYNVDSDFETENGEYIPTEDCKVLIEPHCKVIGDAVEFKGIHYAKGHIVASTDLEWLKKEEQTDGIDLTTGKVTAEAGITFTRFYNPGEYVPVYALNTLKNKNDYDEENNTGDKLKWDALDPTGIIIHNAVFAGGNTSAGSDAVYANATSVFGNVTASIHDVFNRDLITLGTGHTGGLYGDGNLTFVDGYRGLNITNYGTDYYSISQEVTIDEYHALPDREAAYYELKYTCQKACTDKDGTRYTPSTTDSQSGVTTKASSITADDLLVLFVEDDGSSVRVDGDGKRVTAATGGTAVLIKDANDKWVPNEDYWLESGVLPIYAGRLMNSIQRADFCGVFGSRMVMQGAQDRVVEVVDYTNYTINRVREVSLNQQRTVVQSDIEAYPETKTVPFDNTDYYEKFVNHGNYFGIYNIVNYLGALTSDVHFREDDDVRRTSNTSNEEKYKCAITVNGQDYSYGNDGATYYNWKRAKIKDNVRNNGSSYNKVALASGVYLELTTEKSTGKEYEQKDWGEITGVVELDLINVQPGIGGGFVYAKNEHRLGTYVKKNHSTLTALNADAITKKDYTYEDDSEVEWETSGNFVHSTQTIIDDCYNISGRYKGTNKVKAHYWFIKGSVYVYDQYISAYTGTPNAYSEMVEIPLTITAASHGSMKLLNVQPNLYAYYSSPGVPLELEKKVVINDVTYYKNDPISYWDWYLLSKSEKELFVEKTYVTVADCKIGNTVYPEGYVMLPTEYESLKNSAPTQTVDKVEVKAVKSLIKDADGNYIEVKDDNGRNVYKAFDFVFRESNNLSHDTGYILTYKVNNPTEWNTWYTEYNDGSNSLTKSREKKQVETDLDVENENGVKKGPNNGPTYRLISGTGGVLGQRNYSVGELISKEVYDTYSGIVSNHSDLLIADDPDTPENEQQPFVEAYLVTEPLSVPDGDGTRNYNVGAAVPQEIGETYPTSTARAYISTKTIQLSETEFIYLNQQMTEDDINDYRKKINAQLIALGIAASNFSDLHPENNPSEEVINALSPDKKVKAERLLSLKQQIDDNIVEAYYCTVSGLYGGNYYEGGRNYRGLEAWSSMSAGDRDKFTFNYDALDLLIDPTYRKNSEGHRYQYDGATYDEENDIFIPFSTEDQAKSNNPAGYSVTKAVDYTATYDGDELTGLPSIKVKHSNGTEETVTKVVKGDELSREVFEGALTNEQRNYVAVKVTDANAVMENNAVKEYRAYVVSTAFQIGNSPYAVGSVISASEYNSLPKSDKDNVTQLVFPTAALNKTYYYCRESYTVAANNGVSVSNAMVDLGNGKSVPVRAKNANGVDITVTRETTATTPVPVGLVIAEGYYNQLFTNNQQKDFTIHGISPTETSTLYVSRNSDIFDLSTEKIITVVYQYDYEECDDKGNITPLSERHVLNIHINFKSGVPTVDDIKVPKKVLPGDWLTNTGLIKPNVEPGAYEVSGGGWELFATPGDADSHVNGIEVDMHSDKLYWYQDGYYIAYYAKTLLGKTYSNAVPVSVGNYHDLKKVMGDLTHHYYVDRPDVSRPCKIYIQDYKEVDENGDETENSTNGLDLLKNFYDLSLVASSSDGKVTIGNESHSLLNQHVRAGNNLEFFFQTDIDYSDSDTEWTPIGDDTSTESGGKCFQGTVHGDGHTISGLDHSLFKSLCGDVYNLGVSGTFTGAGIAEDGSGYVENCWISTTTDKSKTSAPVFGNPTREATDPKGSIQIVNCYYEENDDAATKPASDTTEGNPKVIAYTNHNENSIHGIPTRKDSKAFYNGEVAFDLNGFYLYKRYCDQTGATNTSYYCYTINSDNTLSDRTVKHYGTNDAVNGVKPVTLCSSSITTTGYVEDRFADGDFRYAGGFIPDDADQRLFVDTEHDNKLEFYPIWPDDYLFFGQMLTYGYNEQRPHEEHPAHLVKDGTGRLLSTDETNRVYRAPAYYQSKEMGVAHYNPWANIAAASSNGTKEVYPNMTAIDFTGHNDNTSTLGGTTWFYQPLLDNDGLIGFANHDETRNLLVYVPKYDAAVPSSKTNPVVNYYATDPVYTETHADYRTVAKNTTSVSFHVVEQTADSEKPYVSLTDHFLVDKQDFNAPIAYSFDSSHRMWYQRVPEDIRNYVGMKKNGQFIAKNAGWEDVSLPFTAELVTTHQKGELTHFYEGSKTGHEYWLREFKGIVSGGTREDGVVTGDFRNPDQGNTTKEVKNDFLWDYYYYETTEPHQKDANNDDYLKYKTYYRDKRTYLGYPLMAGAKAYIIGLPGERYYEFDLSGIFRPETTGGGSENQPGRLNPQTLTFASMQGASIAVSDDETVTDVNGYKFKQNYLNRAFAAGSDIYTLNSDGSGYDKVPDAAGEEEDPVAETPLYAFRPYFAGPTSNPTRSIIFGNEQDEMKGVEEHGDPTKEELNGGLRIWTKKDKIFVESSLKFTEDMRVVTPAGITVATFSVKPGKTVEVQADFSGLYIVHTLDGLYTKKVTVKK